MDKDSQRLRQEHWQTLCWLLHGSQTHRIGYWDLRLRAKDTILRVGFQCSGIFLSTRPTCGWSPPFGFYSFPLWNLTFSRSWDSDSASRSSVSSITRAWISLRRAVVGGYLHCSSECRSDSNGFCCESQSRNPTFLCFSGSTASPGDTGLKEKRNSISFTVQSPKSQLRCQQKTEELAFPRGGRGLSGAGN